MSHETPTIKANLRERLGSRYAQRLRRDGRLPAVIYGHKTDPIAVHVDEKETLRLLHLGIHVMKVEIDGGASETCLVKDLQFGYLGDNVIHLDLTRVDLDEEVHVSVHLRFVGTPEAAKKPGTIVHHDLTELPVICRVRDIPEEIKVDLSSMRDSLAVSEITLPDGVRTDVDPDTAIARIEIVLDTEEGEAAEVEAGGVEPEVIADRKDDEQDGKA